MVEIAVFTPEVVEQLIERGYKPIGSSNVAWYFIDSEEIETAIEEIVGKLR